MKNCYLMKPTRKQTNSGNRVRNFCKNVAKSQIFDRFIFICIMLNSICLSITWYGEPDELVFVMDWVNIVFTIIYTLEMIIK